MSAHDSKANALAGAARQVDWGVIRAAGPDAAKFLHGQLTQDIEHLGAGQARLAGFCSAKGRLMASLVVWRPADEEIMLACSADLLAPTLKRLSMFVLRAKCKLTDESAQLALYGLAGAEGAVLLGSAASVAPWSVLPQGSKGQAQAIRLPDAAGLPRWLLAQPVDQPPPPLAALPLPAWQWLEVQSGVARIVAATSEQFVPQMVNFELVGGVNFQKGCYPGQEIVARSQYRGTLKRRMQLTASSGPLQPGQEVFHSADPEQPAGMVVLAAADAEGQWSALVELKLALSAQPGTLSAGGATLSLGALPYAIPADAA